MTTKPRLTAHQRFVMERLRAGDHWTRCVHTGRALIHETGQEVDQRTIQSLISRGAIDPVPYAPICGDGGGLANG